MTKTDNRTSADKTRQVSGIVPIQADRHGHTSIEVSVVRRKCPVTTAARLVKTIIQYRRSGKDKNMDRTQISPPGGDRYYHRNNPVVSSNRV